MIYDLSKNINEFESKVEFLKKKGCIVELKEKRKKRSISQNNYLHVLFSLFGLNFGYSIEETKVLIKRELKYTYVKNDNLFLKKTSKMDSKELTIFIEKFRNYSNSNGLYLPSSEEYLFNFAEFDRQISLNEIYL